MTERDVLKVAFVGSCCVGKTTLVEEYRKRKIPGLVIVPEVARDYFIKNPMIKNRLNLHTQRAIQTRALKIEQDAHNFGCARIICDRSVLDAAAYIRFRGNIKGSKELLGRVRFWIPTYQSLMLLDPKDVVYQKDSVRTEDEETRKKIHDSFLEMFDEEDIQYELLSGNLEQRVRRVDQLLRLLPVV